MKHQSGTIAATSDRDIPLIRLQTDETLREIYEFGKTLGQGSFGTVYEATHVKTQTKWAVKEVRKPAAGSSKFRMLDNEINILKKVNHPHIIYLEATYNTPTKICLVTELCQGGSLEQLLRQKRFFTEDETREIICCLADAVVYLHKRDIVHRDLKLENILVKNSLDDGRFNIKVADFGLSVKADGVGIKNVLTEACGTLRYMAPEMMSGRGYSHWCDVWSIGVIMFMLLCGEPPFQAKTKEKLLEQIMSTEVRFTQPIWAAVSDGGKYLLTCLLKADPAYRMSAHQLLEHPWITGDTTVPLGPSNVLEMMHHYMLNNQETETGNGAPSSSSEDTLKPRLAAIGLSSERGSTCGEDAELCPENGSCRPSTSTKLSFSGEKYPRQLSATPHKSEDRKDFSAGQNPACDSAKAEEKGRSSSSKAETPLQPSRAPKKSKRNKQTKGKK
ncbi:serine/threonine-protein kinase 33 isoform X1 [Fundulus heteroclitus]|uniref:serine/threonine-protein kinase 33 isoform X1 n=2 Tax=Fundulus heteroclitus TaxID=8078 RepID=UPI00165BB4C4|nr:serine/threonine-protein kinase 33 isoform X1 [Fundulus heteroclitus]